MTRVSVDQKGRSGDRDGRANGQTTMVWVSVVVVVVSFSRKRASRVNGAHERAGKLESSDSAIACR